MSKKHILWPVILGAVGIATSLAVWAQVVSSNDQLSSYVSVVLIPKALGEKGLPTCLDQPECTMKIYRVDPQLKEPQYLMADVYGEKAGKSHFAHAIRFPHKDYWIWIFDAEDMFFHKGLKLWQKDKAGVIGPLPLSAINKRKAVCPEVAERALVSVTGPDGGLRPPPQVRVELCPPNRTLTDGGFRSEAGYWVPTGKLVPDCNVQVTQPLYPDGGYVMSCKDGGGPYYIKQLKYNSIPVANWKDDGGAPTVLRPRKKKLEPRIPTRAWENPDARTHKSCPPVPVGTSCP